MIGFDPKEIGKSKRPSKWKLEQEGWAIYDDSGKDTTQHMYGGYPPFRGEGNPNWKGGITSDWKAYDAMKKREYRKKEMEFLKQPGNEELLTAYRAKGAAKTRRLRAERSKRSSQI